MDERTNTPVAGGADRIVQAIPMACADEGAAVELFEEMRWGDEPYCPRDGCGSMDVYKMTKRGLDERNNRYLWRCRDCGRQFTVRIGTVMEESPIPLHVWAYAFWRACTSKKGVSALEIQRQTGLTYKSALFLMHRIRFAMNGAANGDGPLRGDVEVDETYVGGKPRYKGKSKRGRGTSKEMVVAMVERGGGVRAQHATHIKAGNLKGAILEHVDKPARIITDMYAAYKGIGRHFEGGHETIRHPGGPPWAPDGEWVRGDIHTNTIEGFFSILKRGVYGVWHNVSPKHLHRYVAAAEFRYNTRSMSDGQRTRQAIRGAEGKRLTYRPVTA